MKKTVLLLAFLLPLIQAASAAPGDTIRVKTHENVHIETDPGVGHTAYKGWGTFPVAGTSLRKVMLKLSFRCPPGEACGEWDYLNFIYMRRTGSVNNSSQDLEIARFITPYGLTFNNTWRAEWMIDLSDYEGLLRDSIEIEYRHTGYETNVNRGWLINLEFIMIEGTPVRDFVGIQKLWSGSFPFGNNADPIENYLPAASRMMDPLTGSARLRILQTGHGMDATENCAEFCPKNRTVKFDNVTIETKPVWRDNCGLNAVYPQGGTWIYDRAGWCPGAPVEADAYDFDVAGGSTHSWDMDMQSYSSAGGANYVIEGQLIEYKAPNFTLDVSVEDILAPSTTFEYSRMNPICGKPKIRIRNNGTTALTSCTIEYGVVNGPVTVYTWSGNLGFMKSEEIELDIPVVWASGNVFQAEVKNPNGSADEYALNNRVQTAFIQPPSYPNQFIVNYKANAAFTETQWFIKDHNNTIYHSRTVSAFNQAYNDTVSLPDGCYIFSVTDTDKDGLTFFANSDGSGYVRLKTMPPAAIFKNFNPDFGTGITHEFTVGGYLSIDGEPLLEPEVSVFPNPSNGIVNVSFMNPSKTGSMDYRVYDISGRTVASGTIAPGTGTISISLEGAAGIYALEIRGNGFSVTKKIVRE